MTRRELYVALQMTVAGHPASTVVEALTDSMASAIGFMAQDQQAAHKLARDLAEDMIRAIDKNWDYLRAERAAAGLGQVGRA